MSPKRQIKMGHGGAREGSGRKTLFPGKNPMPRSVLFTDEALARLEAAIDRTGYSRSDVLEGLVLKHLDKIDSAAALERIAKQHATT